MRTPIERAEQPDTPPAPAISLLPGRKLTEPDDQFIHDIATAVRAGARPLTAAQWLGVSRKQWRTWKQRTGEPYDTLRAQVRAALAHLETKLQADLAKRSPGAALRVSVVSETKSPTSPRAATTKSASPRSRKRCRRSSIA